MPPRLTVGERRRLCVENCVLAVAWITAGQELTTEQIAARLGIDDEAAEFMLDRLARLVDIYETTSGRWRRHE